MVWQPFETDPSTGILEAVIEINAKLAAVAKDIATIRLFFEEGDEEEAEGD